MSDSLSDKRFVAGYNQFQKLVRRGKAVKVYLAKDADMFFSENIKRELKDRSEIELVTRYDSSKLASLAGVDVPTAVLTEAKD